MLIKIKHFGKIILIEMLHFMSIGANYIYLRRYFFVSRVNSQKPMVVLKHINILWHSILKKQDFRCICKACKCNKLQTQRTNSFVSSIYYYTYLFVNRQCLLLFC